MKPMNIVLLLSVVSCALHGMLLRRAVPYARTHYSAVPRYTPAVRSTLPSISSASSEKASPFQSPQNRSYWNYKHLPELSKLLPKHASEFDPAHGFALEKSNVLTNWLSVKVKNSAVFIKIASLMYHRQTANEPARPTNNKSMAAYALSPQIIGLVMGALKMGLLQDKSVRQYIVEQWQAEYARMTNEKKRFSTNKINELIDLFIQAYGQDEIGMQAVLLAFLHAKATPENNHDMIHFLYGLNKYIELFPGESDTTYLERYKKSFKGIADGYTTADYNTFLQTIESKTTDKEKIAHAEDNFLLALGAVIQSKEQTKSYPPLVLYAEYGYKGQPAVNDCGEASMHTVFDNLLYNSTTQSFDFSLLPSTLQLNEDFKKFYDTVKTLTSSEAGQAFMNLVSGIDRVSYVNDKNYELEPYDTEKNFIALFNHFFNDKVDEDKKVQTLYDLGKMLSDKRRRIVFIGPMLDPRHVDGKKIIIHIIDRENKESRSLLCCFTPGHGWVEFPSEALGKNILNTEVLSHSYAINPLVRSLFLVQPSHKIDRTMMDVEPIVHVKEPAYYAMQADSDSQKAEIIGEILNFEPHNKELISYAVTLFDSMSNDAKRDLVYNVLSSPLFQEILHENTILYQNFNALIVDNAGYITRQLSGERFEKIILWWELIPHTLQEQFYTNFWNYYATEEYNFLIRSNLLMSILRIGTISPNHSFEEIFSKNFGVFLNDGDKALGLVQAILLEGFANKCWAILKDDRLKKAFFRLLLQVADENNEWPRLFNFYTLIPIEQQMRYLSLLLRYLPGLVQRDNEDIKKNIAKIKNLFVEYPEIVMKSVLTDDDNSFDSGISVLYSLVETGEYKEMFFSILLKVYESLSLEEQIKYMPRLQMLATNALDENIIQNVYQRIADSSLRQKFFAELLMNAASRKLLDVQFINNACQIAVDSFSKEIFIVEVLNAVALFNNSIKGGIVELVKKFIPYDGDLNACSVHSGITSLMAAVLMGSKELIQLLIDHGALINVAVKINKTIENKNSVVKVSPVYQLLGRTVTALHLAVGMLDVELVEFLINCGAEVDQSVLLYAQEKRKSVLWGNKIVFADKIIDLLINAQSKKN